MTLGTSLNQSINQSLFLSLSCKMKVLDQISGFQTKFCGVSLEVAELSGAMQMSSGPSIPAWTGLFFFFC